MLIALGLWLKARVEERFLADEFGSESYAAYQRRVPMLVPFMPRSDHVA
jgi:protein-S-isoprenylcysteine O-methyltransferase Ste14